MNMFSKMIVQAPKTEPEDIDKVLKKLSDEQLAEKEISKDSEEDADSGVDDEEGHLDGAEDFSEEDLFGGLAIGDEEAFAFSISDEEEPGNFSFKTSTDDVEETAANEDITASNKQETHNSRKQSGMMPSLTEQLAQRDKRTESGTTTPAINAHNNPLPNANLEESGISDKPQERIATIPELPSMADFSKDPRLHIKSSVKTRAPKSVQSASRKSFEVRGPLEAKMKKNLMMQRPRESAKMSTVTSANISDGESEREDDEYYDEDNLKEEIDYGTVPRSRRIDTMIDHNARKRIHCETLSMGNFSTQFFAPELDYVRGPRHKVSFSINIQPTIEEETKSEQEEADSVSASGEDEKLSEPIQEGPEDNVWDLVEVDDNANEEIFRYLRTVLKKTGNETALDNLKRLKRVFDDNILKKKEITSERDHLIASHIDFVGTVAEAMSNMKANSGDWVTLS